MFLGTAWRSLKSCRSYELVLFTTFSGNHPPLSFTLSFAKHNLHLYRQLFSSSVFPKWRCWETCCATDTDGCRMRAGSKTRAPEMTLARRQEQAALTNRDTEPRCLISSLHHCSAFKVRILPKHWEYSSRAKTFGEEYIPREAQGWKKGSLTTIF